MDWLFQRIENMMDEVMFSGFYTRRNPSPRDEMLRQHERDDMFNLRDPEPWTPFPFFGDLVKPDMMDRDMFDEAQRQRNQENVPRRDIILDDTAPLGDLILQDRSTTADRSNSTMSMRKWSQTILRSSVTDKSGGVTESETRVLSEPDGTQIATTITRSSQGEHTRVVRKKPTGEEEIEESSNTYGTIPAITGIPTNKLPGSSASTNQPSSGGILESIKKWYRG